MKWRVIELRKKIVKCISMFCLIAAAALVFNVAADVTAAFADQKGGTSMEWESGLDKIRASLSGPVAIAVSVIAIVAAGVALVFGGDMQGFMRQAAYLALVIGLIVMANNILEKLYKSAYIQF